MNDIPLLHQDLDRAALVTIRILAEEVGRGNGHPRDLRLAVQYLEDRFAVALLLLLHGELLERLFRNLRGYLGLLAAWNTLGRV